MKLLLCIPIVNNPHVTRQCIESVVHHPVDVMLFANGYNQEIQILFDNYRDLPNVKIVDRPENIYVNPAWNFFLEEFINNEQYTHLGILNSDIILHRDFVGALQKFWMVYPNYVPIPTEVNKEEIFHDIDYLLSDMHRWIPEGFPGIAIFLNRQHAHCVYPIPKNIKVWFGDNWIYSICRELGFPTVMYDKLKSFHEGSSTIYSIKGIDWVIEQDKEEWPTVRDMMQAKIEKLKQ